MARSPAGITPSDFHQPTPDPLTRKMPMTKLSERYQSFVDMPRQVVAQMTDSNKRMLALVVVTWIVSIVALLVVIKRGN